MAQNIANFSDFKLNKQILNAIADAGYEDPTPIQKKTIPLSLAGHDVMGIAQTGTGKTAAFVLPLIMKLKYAQGNDPRALIIAPTRELVLQIDESVGKYCTYTDLRHTALYGGTGMKAQEESMANGMDLIVATPGRFMDLYRKGTFGTKQIKTFIIDEADKMMDMGFMPQIRKILEIIPVKRQNLLFSATMSEIVEKLSAEFLEFPKKVEATPQSSTVDIIVQSQYSVPNFITKINLVGHLIPQEEFKKVIIFVRTKANADNIFKFIKRKLSKSVKVIHGNKAQNTRINSIDSFKNGETEILVATDVAARGLDVSMVSHVINFDVPIIYEDYVHRIGRTGRAKNLGNAITFVNLAEEHHIKQIEKLINKTIPKEAFPPNVKIEKTPFDEEQLMLREIDYRKRKLDPTFKGAFHDKKDPKKTKFKRRK